MSLHSLRQTHTHTHARTLIYKQTQTYIHTRTHELTNTHTYAYTNTHTHTHKLTHTHTHIHTYIYIYIYIYIFHIHTNQLLAQRLVQIYKWPWTAIIFLANWRILSDKTHFNLVRIIFSVHLCLKRLLTTFGETHRTEKWVLAFRMSVYSRIKLLLLKWHFRHFWIIFYFDSHYTH